jgi:sulfite exporter TauE/SafE
VIPPRLGLSMEFCVALMLILLGVLNISGALRWITERLTQLNIGTNGPRDLGNNGLSTAEVASDSIHSRSMWRGLERTLNGIGIYQSARPLVVGLVHGLAGSAAVALLVLSTIKNPLWATAYLLVFGFGTMAGMMAMTSAISIPLIYTKARFSNITRHLAVISGFFSVAFGTFLVYHIGFVDGLFTSHVHWIPQ